MEHIYPAFERGRIMKKELLWALRDYSYSALQLQYQDYPAGIISGCHISVEDDMLIVGKGIVKMSGFHFPAYGGRADTIYSYGSVCEPEIQGKVQR